MAFASGAAFEQKGHWKSENSTMVMRALAGPFHGSPVMEMLTGGSRKGGGSSAIFLQFGPDGIGGLAVNEVLCHDARHLAAYGAGRIVHAAFGDLHVATARTCLFAHELQGGCFLRGREALEVDARQGGGGLPGSLREAESG